MECNKERFLVVAWGDLGERLGMVNVGDVLEIEGKLHAIPKKDANGRWTTIVEIVAKKVAGNLPEIMQDEPEDMGARDPFSGDPNMGDNKW